MISTNAVELAAAIAVFTFIVGIVVSALKIKFLTIDKHNELCAEIQKPTCKKLDDLRNQIRDIEVKREEAKVLRNRRDLWLAQALQKIADKIGADINDMPS